MLLNDHMYLSQLYVLTQEILCFTQEIENGDRNYLMLCSDVEIKTAGKNTRIAESILF